MKWDWGPTVVILSGVFTCFYGEQTGEDGENKIYYFTVRAEQESNLLLQVLCGYVKSLSNAKTSRENLGTLITREKMSFCRHVEDGIIHI